MLEVEDIENMLGDSLLRLPFEDFDPMLQLLRSVAYETLGGSSYLGRKVYGRGYAPC